MIKGVITMLIECDASNNNKATLKMQFDANYCAIKNPVSLDLQGFTLNCLFIQRRERDSNPRYVAAQWFSRPPHSTTLPSLQYFFARVKRLELLTPGFGDQCSTN